MAELLSRSEYQNPTTEMSPDMLEIVKYLLRGTVEDRTICYALGCSIEVLSNSPAPPSTSSQDWLLESLQRVATSGPLRIQDLASIPETDSTHPAEWAELVLGDQNLGVLEEICETQEQSKKQQQNTHDHRLEYDWDNGPLEIFPSEFVQTEYAPDRGPYSPGAFSLDENDPVLGLAYTDIVS
ncbi:hypothetical protein N7488_006699 [Penicillium malachiteum]|nr:hypothetical protein N7488_006699 [Penicillium malachiteum]